MLPPEKHAREFQKTRTTFPKNMYVFNATPTYFHDTDYQLIKKTIQLSAYCKILLTWVSPDKKE